MPPLLERPFRLVMLILLGASYSIGMSTANRSIFVEMASFHTQILSGAEKVTVLHVDASDAGHCLLDDLGQEGLPSPPTSELTFRSVTL